MARIVPGELGAVMLSTVALWRGQIAMLYLARLWSMKLGCARR
jgi:hypothetical protein